MSPLQPEDQETASLDPPGLQVCLATEFRPKGGKLALNGLGDQRVSLDTTEAVLAPKKKTYFYAGFSNQSIESCELRGIKSTKYSSDMCADGEPPNEPQAEDEPQPEDESQTQLNSYLLLMNVVRVIFTKALAFNTVLTIRALLF